MAIQPNEVVLSMDKHHEATVQAARVMGHIDSTLVSYYSVLRHKPVEEGGVCRFRFYFTGDIQPGLQAKLDSVYKKNNWMGVQVRGWLVKDFVGLAGVRTSEVQDIGGHLAHVFEVELSCLSMLMY
jgi:hypothetical protein